MNNLTYGSYNDNIQPNDVIEIAPRFLVTIREGRMILEDLRPVDYVPRYVTQDSWRNFRMILHREKTLNDIVNFIVCRAQKEFFFGGSLKPLKIAKIAKEFKIHETTVRRALEGVHILFNGQVLELLLLCDNGCRGIAKFEIKKDIIRFGLDKSAQILADLVSEKYGIKMSRRTISKYRNSLNGKIK